MEKKKKVRQITNGKLNTEEIQHLRRSGFPISNKTNLPLTSKRPLRRFAAWWETTTVEKFLEDIVFLLKNAALLDIINLVAGVTIIISLGTWLIGKQERWEDDIFSTWQVINDANNDQSGVTKLALERLLRNGFSLSGLDLSEVNLEGANLQEANLVEADLQEAYLIRANLQEANLEVANLREANLWGANLREANLMGAYLEVANLQEANLWGTNIWGANLQEANLEEANLEVANLQEANLEEAEITFQQIKSACNWKNAIYKGQWKGQWNLEAAVEPSEPDNTNFVEELKKDKSSDPEEAPDCSFWDNKE